MLCMVCGTVLVGDAGVLDMPPRLLGEWQKDKVRALASAIELARERGAERVVVAGGLFAEGFVPQSLLEQVVGALAQCGLPVTYLPMPREAADLEARLAVSSNIAIERADVFEPLAGLRVIHGGVAAELAVTDAAGTHLHELPQLEPQGFGDAGDAGDTGFYLVDAEEAGNAAACAPDDGTSPACASDDGAPAACAPDDGTSPACAPDDGAPAASPVVASCVLVPHALHPFRVLRVSMDGVSTSREMLDKVKAAIDGVDSAVCLRLELRGKAPLQAYFNTDELRAVLQSRFFYAEVANECAVDLSMDELEGDVSLLAEFLRAVAADESLSPTEQSRIMRCGWNALNGKELAE